MQENDPITTTYSVAEVENDLLTALVAKRITPTITLGVALRVGDNGANISKSHDEEGNCLGIKIYEVVVFPEHNIIATTEEEVCSDTKL